MLLKLAVGWQAGSALRGKEVGHFREVAGLSIIAAGGLCFAVNTFNCRQQSGLNKL